MTRLDPEFAEDPPTRVVPESSPESLIDPTRALSSASMPAWHDDLDLDELGDYVGRYRVLGLLGQGGMGVVLHAHDPQLERELAIKLLRTQVDAPDSERGRALLMREARAIARVAHPNVIAIHDVGVHEARVYVVMELVRGRALHQWMRGGHPLSEVLAVFAQAGRGLAAAHAAGLVHRDFKPANVLVGDDGRVRVLDFGLARAPDGLRPRHVGEPDDSSSWTDAEYQTLAGTLAGTPAYMSPEQFERGEADARSDQFAFCVCLYEALFGVRPFVGKSLWALREAVVRKPLALPGSGDGLPMRLRDLLYRGLAKPSAERIADMDALVEELDEIVRDLDSDAGSAIIIAPLGFVATDHGSTGSTGGLTTDGRLPSYLGTLPRGLDSHPKCSMHGAVLRFALARYPLDPKLGLPEQVSTSLDYLSRCDPDEPWIAEVPARVVLAAIYDRHMRSLRSWDEFWAAVARARFTQRFLGFGAPRSGRSLANSLARLWNDFHRGTSLELRSREGELELELSYPNGLLDELAHPEALQLIMVGLRLTGHDGIALRELGSDSRQLHATFTYS